MKAWIVDNSDVYAAETAFQAMSLHNSIYSTVSSLCEIVDERILDVPFPIYDENDFLTTEEATIRSFLDAAEEPCWICQCVTGNYQ